MLRFVVAAAASQSVSDGCLACEVWVCARHAAMRYYVYYLALLLLLLLYHMDRQVLTGLPFNIGTNRLGKAAVLILGVH